MVLWATGEALVNRWLDATVLDRLTGSTDPPVPLTLFLQSYLTLAIGALLVVVMLGFRAATKDPIFRRDLWGATVFLIAFLCLRSTGAWLDEHLTGGLAKALRVAWMLTFAFGVVRSILAVALWVLRFRSTPIPKIIRDVIAFSLYVLTSVPILRTQLDIDLTGLLATSAILSVVLGLALQDTLGNLFAGLSLQLERPFQVGDYVTVEEHTGRVVQLAWRATRIETARREIVTLPNNVIAKKAVLNFSHGLQPVAVDVDIGLSYGAAPNHVRTVVLDVLREIPLLLQQPPPRCRARGFDDSALRYRIRFYVADFAQSENVKDEVFSRLWYRFAREKIEIPYPQRVLHFPTDSSRPEPVEPVGELLSSVDLFSMLSSAEREKIAREVQLRRFGKGERIISEGAAGHTFYLVSSGEVSVRTGKAEAEVARLKRGEYFGEMSLLTGEMRSATVVALEDSVLLELERGSFARLFENQPNLAEQLSAQLAQRRSQLEALAPVQGKASDPAPEARRIFTRLRHIFGLKD